MKAIARRRRGGHWAVWATKFRKRKVTDALSQDRSRFRGRSAVALLPALAAMFALAGISGCRESPPGVRIDVYVEGEEFRPEYVELFWLRPGRMPYKVTLPETGNFEATADPTIGSLGSLFIETVGPLREPRAIIARGFRGGREVSGGKARIDVSDNGQRYVRITLTAPLPDEDNNGQPDAVDNDCLDEVETTNCPDLGEPADGGITPKASDATAPEGADTDTRTPGDASADGTGPPSPDAQ